MDPNTARMGDTGCIGPAPHPCAGGLPAKGLARVAAANLAPDHAERVDGLVDARRRRRWVGACWRRVASQVKSFAFGRNRRGGITCDELATIHGLDRGGDTFAAAQ